MIIISHRGNILGPQSAIENHPDSITYALTTGYDVEVDVRLKDGELWLGHDFPQYKVDESLLRDWRIWWHAKDINAFEYLLDHKNVQHCFWHQVDDYALTKSGHIWMMPGRQVSSRSIIVQCDCDSIEKLQPGAMGVCTDYPLQFERSI